MCFKKFYFLSKLFFRLCIGIVSKLTDNYSPFDSVEEQINNRRLKWSPILSEIKIMYS